MSSLILLIFTDNFYNYSKIYLHTKVVRDNEKAENLPGVTIAKPLINTSDPNLVDNLTTYFTLDYPKV